MDGMNMTENVAAEVIEIPVENAREMVSALSKGDAGVFSTMAAATQAEKIALYQAITDAESIRDHLDEVIDLEHVIAQAVTVAQPDGSYADTVRVILVDTEGRAFSAVSDGLFRSIQNLFGIVGNPTTWDAPIPVKVVEIEGRNRYRFFTIKIAS